ncbi:terpenoid cyclases/protein prenyltransferase alpha-alpha toroid [Microdochium bolleyi]|uniref:Protein farnesyltransferase subunit beta n=1 Tax=Microdochium bolleyi TaxID=196109 RepID=A0A136IMX0_9PEZI|nr:terpenoid cyclases/protein prenyltransferase alpha-alpha toroid [Microdochium bolleyi]
MASVAPAAGIPSLYTADPPIWDLLETPTSHVQDNTVDECRPFLSADIPDVQYNAHGVAHLDKPKHAAFLRKHLEKLPGAYMTADASRPWIFYWCLNGLRLLDQDVSPFREKLVDTARSMQNESGGFGGGFGQRSHLATTYALVLALALVGGDEAREVIDRRAMWKWLSSLKQADGAFQMSLDGEVDVRGAYCATVIVTLLNLPMDVWHESPAAKAGLPDLFTGLADYVRRCQTYEGGISGKPDAEAHGAYAFCALGCLAILESPSQSFTKHLDVPRLMSWLSSRQYAPEGGFSGRTNKLVDGCYSHWVGACWPLIEASLQSIPVETGPPESATSLDLYDREGLIRYILCCGQDQSRRGGMRDKPSRPSDAYHTCYVLSGLSSAQHVSVSTLMATKTSSRQAPAADIISQDFGGDSGAIGWEVFPHCPEDQVFDEQDRVSPIDPVYTIPIRERADFISYFRAKSGF